MDYIAQAQENVGMSVFSQRIGVCPNLPIGWSHDHSLLRTTYLLPGSSVLLQSIAWCVCGTDVYAANSECDLCSS